MIAATAIVHPGARVHPEANIGEYCIVEDGVEIGRGTRLDPFAIVKRHTTLGQDNHLYSGAQLGTDPLDRKFDSSQASYLRVGDRNVLREYLTISRGTEAGSTTCIGSDNYVMTNVHIAHNCTVGDHNVICSCVLIAGYTEIEDHCFISGAVTVHQYSHIGRMSMISGNARVTQDVPPFILAAEFHIVARGLNLVGLRRNGLSRDAIGRLRDAYRLLYRSQLPLADALQRIEEEVPGEESRHLVAFVRASRRGILRE